MQFSNEFATLLHIGLNPVQIVMLGEKAAVAATFLECAHLAQAEVEFLMELESIQ